MRKRVIAGNWKMHKTLGEAEHFVVELEEGLPKESDVTTIICAPFLFLQTLIKEAEWPTVKFAAQNMHEADSGAYTGEISPVMLKDIGVQYVVVGHSERREYFAETDEIVNKKIHAAFNHKILPILCVGESLAQREANETTAHITSQIEIALKGLSEQQIIKTIIAYEPVWAIGTGKTATSEQANEVCAHIRSTIAKLTSDNVANRVIIQYGGSVNPDNIDELLSQSDIDGALVGGASLEVDSFLQLIKAGQR